MHSAISQAIRSAIRQSIEEKKMQAVLWTPATLFAASEPGVWYDPSDMSTMFQDAAGTTPVTAVEQPVGLILDKSKGLVLGPELVTNGDFSNGTTGWSLSPNWSVSGGVATSNGSAGDLFQSGLISGRSYLVQFDVTAYTSGNLSIRNSDTGYRPWSIGTHRVVVKNDTLLVFQSSTFNGSIDNISVRELPGNHATQTTATSRPVLSARYNLLTKTEQFDDAAWGVQAATITANSTEAPDGTSTADTFTETSSSGDPRLPVNVTLVTGSAHSLSVYAKVKPGSSQRYLMLVFNVGFSSVSGVNFDLVTGSVGAALSASGNIENVGNGWYRCSITPNTTATTTSGSLRIRLSNVDTVANIGSPTAYTGDGTSGIYIWGASLVPANQASLPYQRVNTSTDYDADPSKFKPYLRFDGVDDWLVTPTITPGTDKAQVFAGVRKLSDAATGAFIEMGADPSANQGNFSVWAPNISLSPAQNYAYRSQGSTGVTNVIYNGGYTSPITNIVTGLGNISGDSAILRVNGTQAASSTADQGSGNFLAYPLYIGRRGGTTLPFNGHLYGLIVRFGANLPAGTIASTETWLNQRTGAY